MYALGIDLGTTYTAAAVWRGGRAAICPLGTRSAAVPSVVVVRANGTVLTGESADRRAVVEPDRVAREFKRRIGDPIPVLLGGVPHTAEELTAHLLSSVVDAVVGREGGRPNSIVVSHPANWGGFKIDLLRRAVESADLGVPVTYTTEPEAAAISYARQERLLPGETVAVYDLGGGTFDAAVLRRTPTGFTILGQPEGIEHLGGIDIDAAVFAHVARVVGHPLAELDEDDPSAVAAVGRLRTECTEAKEALSTDADTTVPVLLPGFAGEVRLTRAELEAMIRPSLYDSIQSLHRALRSAGVTPEELSAVLLVGGSSRMPLVAQLVGAELGRPVAVDIHPKHAVALGAAWLASGTALPATPTATPSSAPAAGSSDRPTVTAPATGVLPQVPITPVPIAEAPTPPPAAAWFAPTSTPTPPVSPGPTGTGVPAATVPPRWVRDGVQVLRPEGAPDARRPGLATPPPSPDDEEEEEEEEEGRRRRAVLFGGMMGAEAGAAGIAGFEAGRSTASEALRGGHSLAGPQVPDPGSAGGLVQGPSGHLSAHGITPTQAPQPLYSPPPSPAQMLSAPPSTPPSPHGAATHAPSSHPQPGHPGTGHQPLTNHAHTAAAKTAAAGRAAYRNLQVRNPAVAGAAAGLVAVLVVIAGYFALTDDRTATLVASTEPGTSAPADPSPTPTVTVTPTPGRLVVGVSLTGSGGSVTSSDGRISCPGACTASYPAGESVTLVARGSGFLGWSGCREEDGTNCRISGDGAAMPVAQFRAPAVAGSTSSRSDLAPPRTSTTAGPSTTTPTTATPTTATSPPTGSTSTSTSTTASTSTSTTTTEPEITSDPPPAPVDPCLVDPTAPGCQKTDPCLTNPKGAGCTKPDPCVANPKAAGCTPDPGQGGTVDCTKTPKDPRCTVKDPSPEPSPKDSPPKDSPPKDSPPKDSPPKDSPPKDSPPKDSPPKDSPPQIPAPDPLKGDVTPTRLTPRPAPADPAPGVLN